MRRTSTWPQGATTDVVVNYTVTDEHGATSTATLTITVDGRQRRAGGGRRQRTAGNEDATITGTVATNDSDVDDGASAELRCSMRRLGAV